MVLNHNSSSLIISTRTLVRGLHCGMIQTRLRRLWWWSECAIPSIIEITPHPPPRCFLPVSVMDIMGLLRANRSPYLYPRYLAPAKNCLKQSHTSRLIQNVHPAHTPVTVWDYKIIHPSNIKCTLHSSLLPVREEHMRYKGESRADNALQWLN